MLLLSGAMQFFVVILINILILWFATTETVMDGDHTGIAREDGLSMKELERKVYIVSEELIFFICYFQLIPLH